MRLYYILYRMNIIPIIYENDAILIINKPTGIAVQGGKGISSSIDTILPKQLGYKVYLVHRLDRDTAGLLVVAKNSQAAAEWTNLISSTHIQKEYYAMCVGEFSSREGTIAEAVVHRGIAKQALTYFSLEKTCIIALGSDELSGQSMVTLSLVRLKLGTGRMHQLRIHLAAQGTPIIGDDKYGDFKLNKNLRKYCGIKKMQLAASRICFSPKGIQLLQSVQKKTKVPDEKRISGIFEVPLPEHMKKTLILFV